MTIRTYSIWHPSVMPGRFNERLAIFIVTIIAAVSGAQMIALVFADPPGDETPATLPPQFGGITGATVAASGLIEAVEPYADRRAHNAPSPIPLAELYRDGNLRFYG